MGEVGEEEGRVFLDMVRVMLKWRPEERLTARGVLETEWMRIWGLSAL